jgi:hypothetical protein
MGDGLMMSLTNLREEGSIQRSPGTSHYSPGSGERFAKRVFLIAGIWGVLIMTSMYFLFDTVNRQYPPPITHPDFYYGFVSITFAWQIVFLLISTDPIRYRPIMVAALIEKIGYIATLGLLYANGQIQFGQFAIVAPDCILGVLFTAAFLKTKGSMRRA